MSVRLTSGLGLMIAATAGGLLLSTPAHASLTEEPFGDSARVEPSRDRRAKRSTPIQLAAKKKKKKKAGKHPATDAPAEQDSGGDTEGSSDSTTSGGASDAELQKAARVAPKASGDDAVAKTATSKKTVAADDSAGSGLEGPTPRFLDVAVGGQGFSRSLRYNQYLRGDVREYEPKLLGGAVAAVDWYPGAHFTRGFATNIGLDLNIAQAFGVSSRGPDGTKFPTKVHDYNGGLKVRIPLDGGIEPSLTVGYGDHAFTVSGANRPPLPNTEYKYLRAVAGVRIPVATNIAVMAGAGYRHILSPGDIKTTYFPNLAVKGIEADAGVGYAITNMIEARLGVDLRRYFYTFHSKNADMFVAGGAIDQTIAFNLSLAVMLGGPDQARSSGASEEAPAAPAGDGDADAKPKRKKAKRPTMEGDGAPGME